ncbi:MAG TPA: hypothetical protein VFZ31_06940 [Vicinamibacterales bacterium]
MARSSSKNRTGFSPLLAHVIRAVADESPDRARALDDLARLFELIVPLRGIAPAEEVRAAIERIATRRLARGSADAALRRAVSRVASVKDRDAIENACVQLLEAGEVAHYYAGLAAGITLAELGRRSN